MMDAFRVGAGGGCRRIRSWKPSGREGCRSSWVSAVQAQEIMTTWSLISSSLWRRQLITSLLPGSRNLLRPFSVLSVHRRSPAGVVEILEERGLLGSLSSDSLRSPPSGVPLKAYCGFDPTAPSLHLGNLHALVVLTWFQRCGHPVIALIGSATALVGDPSGKSLERPKLDLETLRYNTLSITRSVTDILSRAAAESPKGPSFQVLNNSDWLKDVVLVDFLQQVGSARVGTMMSKESVKRRLESEQGMSYAEFSYPLLQGYDFLYLYKKEKVNVQIGGSDQWGNIIAGIDIVRRNHHQPQSSEEAAVFGLTFPLMLKSDGTKFGKSEDGAVWLSPAMLSPYKFYQSQFSVPDADVISSLKMRTLLDMEEIHELERQMQAPGYLPNTAQRKLAEEVTRFVHGEDGLQEALKATEVLRPGAKTMLDWMKIPEDVPSCSLAYDQLLHLSVVDLSVSSGLLESKSAARRLLKQGGLYLNNTRVDSDTKRIETLDIVDGKLLLSGGKKNKVVVRILRLSPSH